MMSPPKSGTRLENDVDDLEDLVTSLRIGQAEQGAAIRGLTDAIGRHEALDGERHTLVLGRLDTITTALASRADDVRTERAEQRRETAAARAYRLRVAKVAGGVLAAAIPVLGAVYGVQTGAIESAAAAVVEAVGPADTDAPGGTDGGGE